MQVRHGRVPSSNAKTTMRSALFTLPVEMVHLPNGNGAVLTRIGNFSILISDNDSTPDIYQLHRYAVLFVRQKAALSIAASAAATSASIQTAP